MKNILILCIFIFLIIGCRSNDQAGDPQAATPQLPDSGQAESNPALQIVDGHTARTSLDYEGTYVLEDGSETIEITFDGTFSTNINGEYSGNFEWLTGFVIGMTIGGIEYNFFVGENFLRQIKPDRDKNYIFRMKK